MNKIIILFVMLLAVLTVGSPVGSRDLETVQKILSIHGNCIKCTRTEILDNWFLKLIASPRIDVVIQCSRGIRRTPERVSMLNLRSDENLLLFTDTTYHGPHFTLTNIHGYKCDYFSLCNDCTGKGCLIQSSLTRRMKRSSDNEDDACKRPSTSTNSNSKRMKTDNNMKSHFNNPQLDEIYENFLETLEDSKLSSLVEYETEIKELIKNEKISKENKIRIFDALTKFLLKKREEFHLKNNIINYNYIIDALDILVIKHLNDYCYTNDDEFREHFQYLGLDLDSIVYYDSKGSAKLEESNDNLVLDKDLKPKQYGYNYSVKVKNSPSIELKSDQFINQIFAHLLCTEKLILGSKKYSNPKMYAIANVIINSDELASRFLELNTCYKSPYTSTDNTGKTTERIKNQWNNIAYSIDTFWVDRKSYENIPSLLCKKEYEKNVDLVNADVDAFINKISNDDINKKSYYYFLYNYFKNLIKNFKFPSKQNAQKKIDEICI